MREAPLRQRVRREALVEHHDRRLEARILEIRKELREELRHDHTLVDDRARRQGRNIEDRILAFQLLLGAAARKIELAIERRLIDVRAAIDECLLDDRQASARLFAAGPGVRGYAPESREFELLPLQLRAQRRARGFGQVRVAIQKNESGRERGRQLEARVGGDRAQERGRHLDQQTATVTGLAIGGDRASMGQPIQ
jgi:hypothetical protein